MAQFSTIIPTKTGTLPWATPSASRHNTRLPTFRLQPGTRPLPRTAAPTTIQQRGDTFTHTGITSHCARSDVEPSRWWGTVIHYPNSFRHIVDGIIHGTAVIVTDGSYKDGLGTAAYTLHSALDNLDGLDAVNMTPGEAANMDPYRAELGGIYGSIQMAHLIQTRYAIPRGSITLFCDCQSALHRITQPSHPMPRTPHYDLILAIRILIQTSTLDWHFQHVPAHQDSRSRYEFLDRKAQMNVDMDQLAKNYWTILDASRPPPFSLPHSEHLLFSLWCRDHRLLVWDRPTAQTAHYNTSITTYWQQRSTTPLHNIAWEASGRALRQLTLYQQTWIPRWLTSFVPTGNRMHLINSANSLSCPRCTAPELHRYHVLRCPQPDATLLWQSHVTKLNSWLMKQQTKRSLQAALLSLIDAWYVDTPWVPTPTVDQDDHAAFEAQQQAGTHRVMDGFLVMQWAEVQQRYYVWIRRHTSGQRWLTSLIKHLWEISWDMWRHRHKVLQNPNEEFRRNLHRTIDDSITETYNRYNQQPHPSLSRWMAQPLPALLAENLEFKQQWMAMTQAILHHRQRTQPHN